MRKLTDEQKAYVSGLFNMDELFEFLSMEGWDDEDIDPIAERITHAINKVIEEL